MTSSSDSIACVLENPLAEAPKSVDAAPAVPDEAAAEKPVAAAAAPGVSAAGSASAKAEESAAAPAPQRPIPEVKPEARRPSASLIPFLAPPGGATATESSGGSFWRVAFDRRFQVGALAAALALAGVVTLSSVFDGDRNARSLQAQVAENQTLHDAVRALKTRIGALEAARHDEAVDLRKTGAEIRSGLAGTRDANAALAQLGARVDRLERDADSRIEKLSERVDRDSAARSADFSARIEKLGERLDHDAATHNADLTARIEKLEKKQAAPLVASLAPAPPANPLAAPPKPPIAPPVFGANVSHETTGSIMPPRPIIRGWVVRDAQDGMALVEGPYGYRQVAPGEYLPGAGRVERIEKRGADWHVVTSQGTIAGAMEGNF